MPIKRIPSDMIEDRATGKKVSEQIGVLQKDRVSVADYTTPQLAADSITSGGILFFPYGSYSFDGLVLKPNTILIGYGATITARGGNTNNVLTLASNCKVYGLTINGNKTNRTGGKGINVPNGVANYIIKDCYIFDCVGQGIMLDFANKGIVSSNRIEGCQHGIQWWGGDSAITTIRGIFDISISDNIVKNVDGGIWGSLGERITVQGNTVENCTDVGIDFEGCYYSTCVSNSVKNCKNGAIAFFYTSKYIEVTGNTILQEDTYGYGVWFTVVGSLNEFINVHGNAIHTHNRFGVSGDERSATNCRVVHNIIKVNTSAEGIKFLDCHNIDIESNRISVVSGYGIVNQGGSNYKIMGNHIGTTSDTNAVGTGGGIWMYFRSATFPCQKNTVKDNVINGFNTSINDDCWGDLKSWNWISGNRCKTVYRRTGTGYSGKVAGNVQDDNPTIEILETTY